MHSVVPGPLRYVEGLPQPPRTLVMGVVNVTPDSFSDGGRYADPERAVAHGLALAADGADLVDVGGESTRPGAVRPSVDEELSRVVPVVEGLVARGVPVSVDTMRAAVAAAAVEAGAALVNDVSGGLADDDMLTTIARLDVPCVLMHWRAHSTEMERHAVYRDVVAEVVAELSERLRAAARAGITHSIAIDPGIGFAKSAEHNWTLLQHLEELHELGHPLLVATSRKRFLGALLAAPGSDPADAAAYRPAGERDAATAATSALAAAGGAWCVRVHDVRASADAVRVAARWGHHA